MRPCQSGGVSIDQSMRRTVGCEIDATLGEATNIVLEIQGELTLPLPGLMKMVAAPIAEAEFEKMVEQYIDNLTKHFGGEA